jgi:hypothetical protein
MQTTSKTRMTQMMAIVLSFAMLFAVWFVSSTTARHEITFDSPLSTPPPPPPTPSPSTEAQIALRYVAERYGIPIEQLVVVNEHQREYAELGRAFRAFSLLDLAGDRFFNLLVDLEDHTVVEDVAAVQRAEDEAQREKYGKLDPALYERLRTMEDDETIRVTIWVAAGPGQSLDERELAAMATLAAKYPEVQAALERGGKPMDVDDPELAERVYAEYVELVEADLDQRGAALVETLKARGFAVKTAKGLPAVMATLPKQVITQLAERDDVGLIYLVAEPGSDEADATPPTDQQLAVWGQTFSGWGGLIAAAVVWGLALPLIYLSRRAGGLAGKRLRWVILTTVTALPLPLLYLTACQPRESELPFETIERRDWPGSGREWEVREAGMMIMATSEDLAQTDNLFTEDAQAQLRELDFDAYFAVAVFLGWQGSGHEGIDIERVVRRGDEVSVYVKVGGPRGTDEETSPYHLVKVRKEGNWDQTIHFTLYMDGTEAVSPSHFIP